MSISFQVAVLSDIHENSWALQAVLKDVASRGIKELVNLGDSFYGPLDPYGTSEILLDLEIPSVMGNEDRVLLEEKMTNPTADFTQKSLNPEALAWLQDLKTNNSYNDALLCHGSPSCDTEYLLEEVTESGVKLRSLEHVSGLLGDFKEEVILCGHSHVPHVVHLSDGRTVINPGSVGLQAYDDDNPMYHIMETGSPHARYSIVSKSGTGILVDNIAVPYNWDYAAAVAMKNGRPDWVKWLGAGRAV
ncbi:MAG: metallophosphoesterase family protein [Candidatus Thorarchaeota archaeon]